MIKLSYFIRRQPAWQRENFHTHWRENHAALIKKHAATFGLQRYVQLHAAEDPRNQPDKTSPLPFDGVAELWFDSMDAFEAGDQDRQRAVAELLEDERTFIDLPNSPMWLAEEHVVVS